MPTPAVPTLSIFRGVNAYDFKETVSLSWDQLVRVLSAEFTEFKDKPTRNEEADYFCPVRLYPGREHRSEYDTQALTVACFDYDKCTPEDVARSRARIQAAGVAQFWYSSYSYAPDSPAYRLLVPITHELSSAAWKVVRSEMVRVFDLKVETGKCENISHGYFAPVVPSGGTGLVYSLPGKTYDTEAVAALYPPGSEPPPKPKLVLPPEPTGPIDLEPIHERLLAAAKDHRAEGDEAKALMLERVVAGVDLRGGIVVSDSGDTVLTRATALVARAAPDLSMGTYMRVVDRTWRKMVDNGANIPESRVESKFEGILRKVAAEQEKQDSVDEVLETVLGLSSTAVDPPPVQADGFAEMLAKAKADLQARGAGAAPRKRQEQLTPETMASLRTKEFPTVPWVIRGVLVQKALNVIAGEPKTTKTWSAMEMALAVASGTNAFGEFPACLPGPVVLFLVEDDKRSIRNRLRALSATREMTPEQEARVHVFSREAINLENVEDLAWLVACIRSLPEPPVMVVLDPLRDLHSGDEDNSTSMSLVGTRLRALRDVLDCAVVFVHHAAKTSKDVSARRPGQRMRGSGAIHGFVDGGLYLYDLDTDMETYWENSAAVELKAARGAGGFSLRLDVEDEILGEAKNAYWKFSHTRANAGSEADREKIVTMLRAKRDEGDVKPMGADSIKAALGLKGHKSDVLAMLKDLVRDGRLEDRGKAGVRAVLADGGKLVGPAKRWLSGKEAEYEA